MQQNVDDEVLCAQVYSFTQNDILHSNLVPILEFEKHRSGKQRVLNLLKITKNYSIIHYRYCSLKIHRLFPMGAVNRHPAFTVVATMICGTDKNKCSLSLCKSISYKLHPISHSNMVEEEDEKNYFLVEDAYPRIEETSVP